ncbi:MAG: hypothetical protein U0166_00105 [Acidobacteriota bacterium]
MALRLIHLVRALVWLRARLLVNGFRGGRTRDRVERISRAAALVLPIVSVAIFVPAAAAVAFLGFEAGIALAQGGTEVDVVLALRYAAATLAVIVIAAVLFRAQSTDGLSLAGLATQPVGRTTLHTLQIVAALLDPWIAFAVPGAVALSGGLIAAGKIGAGAIALCAGLVRALALASAMTLLGCGAAIVLSGRRRREAFSALLIGAFLLLPLASLLFFPGGDDRRAPSLDPGTATPWLSRLPTEHYVMAVVHAAEGRSARALASLGALAMTAVPIYAVSLALHAHLLGNPSSGTPARRGARAMRRFPGLGTGASAIAAAQVRTVLRSVQGKIAFLAGPVVFASAACALVRKVPARDLEAIPHGGVLLAGAGISLTMLSAVGIMVNQLAADRSGLTLSLLAPLTDIDIVIGKAAAFASLTGASALLIAIPTFVLLPGDPLSLWMALPVAFLSAYLPIAPIAAILSAVLPRATAREDLPGATKPHELAAFAGFFLPMLFSGPPAGIMLHAVRVAHRPALALLTLSIWLVLSAAISIPLFALAASTVGARRENLALVAQGR